ncbi:MAG: hypothetical protein BWX70_03209 [Verrucomicrobia bacterium ADurb.Bin070]|nr:MAG: hypothetical protein BWX70_03209 [Verrucomicrobia bacterium ADurb.Bin070]
MNREHFGAPLIAAGPISGHKGMRLDGPQQFCGNRSLGRLHRRPSAERQPAQECRACAMIREHRILTPLMQQKLEIDVSQNTGAGAHEAFTLR